MNYRIILFISSFFLFTGVHLFSQKTVKIGKTDNPPIIDGMVDDICWESAASINEFYQREPLEGEPLTERTEVYICYNADYIFFGFKCYQPPKSVTAKEKQRDARLMNDDRVAIILDTYLDHRNAYFLGINALGAVEDAVVTQNGINRAWNGLFVAKSKITDIGWEAELRSHLNQ